MVGFVNPRVTEMVPFWFGVYLRPRKGHKRALMPHKPFPNAGGPPAGTKDSSDTGNRPPVTGPKAACAHHQNRAASPEGLELQVCDVPNIEDPVSAELTGTAGLGPDKTVLLAPLG